jgi:hypothetical protein
MKERSTRREFIFSSKAPSGGCPDYEGPDCNTPPPYALSGNEQNMETDFNFTQANWGDVA